jgi:hypothetical protein
MLSGCASKSGGAESQAPRTARITPPSMIRGPVPDFRGRFDPIDTKLEVMIDANGDPVMNTLKFTGTISGASRDAVRDWIQRSRFRPALQGKTPVAAVYTTEIKTTVTVQRVR